MVFSRRTRIDIHVCANHKILNSGLSVCLILLNLHDDDDGSIDQVRNSSTFLLLTLDMIFSLGHSTRDSWLDDGRFLSGART